MADFTAFVALLVSGTGTTNLLLRAVSLGVTLDTTVEALHRTTLDPLVGAFVGSVTGLLAVVANLRTLVVSSVPGWALVGDVSVSSTRVAGTGLTTGTSERSSVSLGTTGGWALTCEVTGLPTLVTSPSSSTSVSTPVSSSGSTPGTSSRASSGNVTALTALVAGLGGPVAGVGAFAGLVAGLTTVVAHGRVGALRSLVGSVTTVETTSRSVHLVSVFYLSVMGTTRINLCLNSCD